MNMIILSGRAAFVRLELVKAKLKSHTRRQAAGPAQSRRNIPAIGAIATPHMALGGRALQVRGARAKSSRPLVER
jgi:hypothetical protein